MKSKSQRLSVVLDLANRKEELALDSLTKTRRYFDQQQAQLDSLTAYEAQSMQDLKSRMMSVHDVSRLMASQDFIQQISQAIHQQSKVNESAKKEHSLALKEWMACHQKTKSMSDLIKRYRIQEQYLADKKIEKQIEDEFISRRYR